ncbi:hypothetical protein AVEN_149087-1 [Araneus ventricosus]|uniref:Uncharacterized protein n=1 Tax=Araneus ventricosus TaxID=182803 RepID=A0A4Y2HC38_ARAVE|nr:hypothetical protein AVEN_149087-1 [Araneus ventricosus]
MNLHGKLAASSLHGHFEAFVNFLQACTLAMTNLWQASTLVMTNFWQTCYKLKLLSGDLVDSGRFVVISFTVDGLSGGRKEPLRQQLNSLSLKGMAR